MHSGTIKKILKKAELSTHVYYIPIIIIQHLNVLTKDSLYIILNNTIKNVPLRPNRIK